MKKFLFAAAFLLLFSNLAASAQTATPGITARQHNEQARIRQGARSGELTRGETRRLKNREADIRQDKQAARADGVVTRDERQGIRKEEAKTSRAIYRQKHDGQVR